MYYCVHGMPFHFDHDDMSMFLFRLANFLVAKESRLKGYVNGVTFIILLYCCLNVAFVTP